MYCGSPTPMSSRPSVSVYCQCTRVNGEWGRPKLPLYVSVSMSPRLRKRMLTHFYWNRKAKLMRKVGENELHV